MNERYHKYEESYKRYRDAHKEKMSEIQIIERNKRRFGGMRDNILERDLWRCVSCGMTNEQHIVIFARSITIDHIDGNRNNNKVDNLQTLCLRCHGAKDVKRRKDRLQKRLK